MFVTVGIMTGLPTTASRINPFPLQTSFYIFHTEVLLKANVVICEFTHVVVVNTDDLCLFVAAETETWDEVHDPKDNGCHDQRIAEASAGVSELPSQLDPVAIEPTTWDFCKAIKARNGRLCENAREHLSR
jgi:hypothetical protein